MFPRPPQPPPSEPVADPALLEELARMTPEERLRWNDLAAATIQELRHGFGAAADDPARQAVGERR